MGAMDWLKGLVPPAQIIPPGQPLPPVPGMGPVGGGPPGGPPPGTAPAATPSWMGTPPAASPAGTPDARVAALEAQCMELRRDVESLALFSRTLLTMLEERGAVTRAQFDETKRRLDMMDGRLDDRMG